MLGELRPEVLRRPRVAGAQDVGVELAPGQLLAERLARLGRRRGRRAGSAGGSRPSGARADSAEVPGQVGAVAGGRRSRARAVGRGTSPSAAGPPAPRPPGGSHREVRLRRDPVRRGCPGHSHASSGGGSAAGARQPCAQPGPVERRVHPVGRAVLLRHPTGRDGVGRAGADQLRPRPERPRRRRRAGDRTARSRPRRARSRRPDSRGHAGHAVGRVAMDDEQAGHPGDVVQGIAGSGPGTPDAPAPRRPRAPGRRRTAAGRRPTPGDRPSSSAGLSSRRRSRRNHRTAGHPGRPPDWPQSASDDARSSQWPRVRGWDPAPAALHRAEGAAPA